MNDQQILSIKSELDDELKSADPKVGIAFGMELFNAFQQKGWFTLEDFGWLGTPLFSECLPAYGRSHYAFPNWDLPDFEFRVGKSQ